MKKGVVDRPRANQGISLLIIAKLVIFALLIAQFAHIPFDRSCTLFASLGVYAEKATVSKSDLAWLLKS